MKVGLSLPFTGDLAGPEAITAYARQAEGLGYHSVWVGDHVVFPDDHRSRYPYSATWSGPSGDTPVLDPLATLAFVSAATSRVRIGTSVLLLPLRNPVLQAKAMATLDVLSGGRTIYGLGVGWLEAEFEALGVAFEGRGARAEEYLEVIRRLWSGREVAFDGAYYQLPPCMARPVPVQRPGPPVWIGGNSLTAQRRAVRLADGWIAAFSDTDGLLELLARLDGLLAQAERPISGFARAVMMDMPPATDSDEAVRDGLGRMEEAGVGYVIARSGRRSPAEDGPQMQRFIELVGPEPQED